jgi:predicted RNA-binding Zn ribbon-like protein
MVTLQMVLAVTCSALTRTVLAVPAYSWSKGSTKAQIRVASAAAMLLLAQHSQARLHNFCFR